MWVDLFLFKPILYNPFESGHIISNEPEMKKYQIEFEYPDNKSQTTQSQLNKILSIPCLLRCKLIVCHQVNPTRNQINTHKEKTADYHSYEISVVRLSDTRICPNAMVVELSHANLAISTVFCIF